MHHSFSTLLLSGTLLFIPFATRSEPVDTHTQETAGQMDTEHWLEEVKAQRQAWEARRKAAKQASDARLRQFDPWGAARLQTLEKAADMRRAAQQNHTESVRRRAEAQFEAWRHAHDSWLEQQDRRHTTFQPHGWDNRWYFRGY